MHLVRIKTTWFTQQKQWGLYQNKVTFSLTPIQWPGHRADNCKMVYSYCNQSPPPRLLIVCFGTQKISTVGPWDKCSRSTHKIVMQAQMACIKCLFYNFIYFRTVYSWWAQIQQEKGIFYLVNSLIKFNFDCYSCTLLFRIKHINKLIHTWSNVMQWSPERQPRKDVCRENSLKEGSSLELKQM